MDHSGSVTLPAGATAVTINVTAGGVPPVTATLATGATAYTYTLNNVPAGSITVYAYATGYATNSTTVTVTNASTVTASAIALVAGTSTLPPAYVSGNNVVVASACCG